MLHKNTVSHAMWELMKRLMKDALLKDFVLVGGTALSLKIGHRMSVDIDLFTVDNFDARKILRHLELSYGAETSHHNTNSIMTFINDIKVDLVSHKYPQIEPAEIIENVRIISIEDIGAMKLHAIVQSGKRYKDFVDMYHLLEHNSLQTYLNAHQKKYDTNPSIARNGLLYHDSIISFQGVETPDGNEIKWDVVKERLRKANININAQFKSIGKERKNINPAPSKRRGSRL